MAKDRSFAAKTAKVGTDGEHCPVCGNSYTYLKHYSTSKFEKTGSWKLNKKMVRVCRCNEKEIYG